MPKLMQHFRKLYSSFQYRPAATLKAVAATNWCETACIFWTSAVPHFAPIVRIGPASIPATCRSILSLTG